MNKTVLVILLVATVLGLGAFLLVSNSQTAQGTNTPTGKVHKMILSENGYEPQDITIKKSDIVEFSTKGDKPFWPASDIHPTHGIYPEFDPQDAIQQDKTWSFQFNKTGTWRYHDHLYPYFSGKITVQK